MDMWVEAFFRLEFLRSRSAYRPRDGRRAVTFLRSGAPVKKKVRAMEAMNWLQCLNLIFYIHNVLFMNNLHIIIRASSALRIVQLDRISVIFNGLVAIKKCALSDRYARPFSLTAFASFFKLPTISHIDPIIFNDILNLLLRYGE